MSKLSTPVALEIGCQVRLLPADKEPLAAETARAINPANGPPDLAVSKLWGDTPPLKEELAFLTSRYWGTDGVQLTVGFLDNPDAATRRKILEHMNAWGQFAKAKFLETASSADAQVRIARAADGYWSYLGTDILTVPRGQPTMNLQDFTASTPESEYLRVVQHETGHTLGAPHEHLRAELVALIDPAKAIAYFRRTSGWSESVTRSNVLTPLEERSLLGSTPADPVSIMCYSLPGSIMKDGKPLQGGADFSPADKAWAARIYPLPTPPPPPPPPPGNGPLALSVDPVAKVLSWSGPGWSAQDITPS